MWSVMSGDFDQQTSEEKCYNNVIRNAKDGSIIVFHDSTSASKNLRYALPRVLEYFSNKGYQFKSLAF
jgi:peptidoglycan/xylan/chitin deacetylase (PgdA/CDA1 family)